MFKIDTNEAALIFSSAYESRNTKYNLQNVKHISVPHVRPVFNKRETLSFFRFWSENIVLVPTELKQLTKICSTGASNRSFYSIFNKSFDHLET